MLHSVYFWSLVDLENKSCERLSLVNIYRQSAKHISNKEFRLKVILYNVWSELFDFPVWSLVSAPFIPGFILYMKIIPSQFIHFDLHTSRETKLLTNHLKGFFRPSRQLALWQSNYKWHPYATLVFKINLQPQINWVQYIIIPST